MLKAIGLWLVDFVLVPTRVARLAKVAEADRDPRPVCLACGNGRVGLGETRPGYMIGTLHFGACPACGAAWKLETDPLRIVGREE
jgi:hypothetical protein